MGCFGATTSGDKHCLTLANTKPGRSYCPYGARAEIGDGGKQPTEYSCRKQFRLKTSLQPTNCVRRQEGFFEKNTNLVTHGACRTFGRGTGHSDGATVGKLSSYSLL